MKQLRKPTVKQMALIESRRLDPRNWMVERDTSEKMTIVNRASGNKRNIYKEI